MAQFVSNINGLNLYVNPLSDLANDGQVIRAVNVDSSPYGAKNKRSGYIPHTFALSSKIDDLFSWTPDGTTVPWVYANAGGSLFYSVAGTGAWTICGNGTVTAGSHVGRSVLNNTLIISQNGGTTRHTTNGTSFSDTSSAPAGQFLEQYQNRIHLTGTSNAVSYSVTGDPTNWAASGTSDGGVFTVPGAGLPNRLFKLADRLFISKESRNVFRWDGYSLVDTSTNLGPSSPYSYGSVEGNGFWINEKGVFTSAGDAPQLISNPIYRFFNNNTGSAIAGTSLGTAPGATFYYDYLVAVGSMTDDLTNETVPNAIVKYNFQKNEFINWSFRNFPTAIHSYRDSTNMPQLIFGDANGNIYRYMGTATSDNGAPIEAVLELMFDFGNPVLQKDWRTLWAFFNPGCSAQVSVAISDTFIKEEKQFFPIGSGIEGAMIYRFSGQRGRFLYVKITENSGQAPFTLYGIGVDADLVPQP